MSSRLWHDGSDGSVPDLAIHQHEALSWVRDRIVRYGAAVLADDVGLGKSWVAAAIAREQPSGSVELVVPASILAMWREVCAIFDLDCAIVSHELIRRETKTDASTGLVIVDEAHRFRNPSTKGWKRLGRRVIGRRALFLTATPIWNDPRDLLSLLRLMVADDALKLAGVASIELGMESETGRSRVIDQLILRRGHDVLPPTRDLGRMHDRTVRYPTTEGWREVDRQLRALEFPHCLGYSDSILRLLMLRRLHSSPAALRSSVERQLRFCRSGLDLLQSGFRLNRREFTRHLVVDEGVQELLFPQLFLEPEDEPDAERLEREIERLDTLLHDLSGLVDSKADLLEELLRDHLASLIFVGAVDTAKALFERLSTIRRCGLATGSVCRSRAGSRSIGAIAGEFQNGLLDLLILTDLGAEGLNLQRADRVVHYDLPWSPMRLEQRNGRARRIGRDGRSLEVVTFAPEDDSFIVSSVLAEKRRAARTFWNTTLAESARSGDALDRLPSRITAAEPQPKLWSALPPASDRSPFLRRYVAALEDELRNASAEHALARIQALYSFVPGDRHQSERDRNGQQRG